MTGIASFSPSAAGGSGFPDCRPIYVRRALEEAGFPIRKALTKHMWIPVEIVLGVKE